MIDSVSVVPEPVAVHVPPHAPDPAGAGRRSRSLGQNIAALGAGQLFTWAMTLSWTLVVPRLLGVGVMGMIVTGMSVALILQILLGAGTATYITREMVISEHRSGPLIAGATIGRLLLIPVFAAATYAWTRFAGYSSRENVVLYLCSAATAVTLLSEPILCYFQASERMHYMAIGNAINKASQGLGGIILAILGFGALGFAWCWIVTASLVVVLGIRWASRYVTIHWRTSWQEIRGIARGSAVYWTGGVFFTIYAWIDTAMLSVMTNPTVVGWYGVPMRLWGTMLVIPSIFTTAWLPRLVQAHKRSNAELIETARAPIELVFMMSLPTALLVVIGAKPAMQIIYGSSYDKAIPVLVILGLNLIPMYLNIMLAQVCVAGGRQKTWNWMMVGASIFNPAVNAVLIPLTQHHYGNGAIGAAIALASTEVLIVSAGVFVVGRRIVGLTTVVRFARMATACVGAWLVDYLLRNTDLILPAVAGGAALAVLMVLTGAITKSERQQVVLILARVKAKVARQPIRREGTAAP